MSIETHWVTMTSESPIFKAIISGYTPKFYQNHPSKIHLYPSYLGRFLGISPKKIWAQTNINQPSNQVALHRCGQLPQQLQRLLPGYGHGHCGDAGVEGHQIPRAEQLQGVRPDLDDLDGED